jgi:nondiscriminating aspartyl-tRNA synthetase
MQCIALKSQTEQSVFESIDKISKESVVEIKGKVTENKESRWGVEILIEAVNVLNEAEVIPIDNSDKSTTELEKRIDYRFLDTRNAKKNAIFRIRSKIVRIVTDFFDEEGFTNINTPKITCIGVESGAALFNVKYFDRTVYLSQSPQVYKQMFVAGGFERVYEIGVVFRAENSNTTRHLTEFTGIDFEMGFINGFEDVMDTIEKMFMYLLERLKKECVHELKVIGAEISKSAKIPRMTMEDAKKFLTSKGRSYTADDDLDPEGERLLGDYAKEKFGSEFIFITHFPWAIRPFYHMRPADRQDLTCSFDLLYNGVEIATGAQREHRLEILKAQTKEKGLDMDEMPEYCDIFKYGIPPHGGVGFGLDRITQRLLDLSNVRESVLLPRDPKRTKP